MTTELILCEGNGRLRRASRSPAGDGWEEVALPEEGLWPSWSPDGAGLAVAWAGTLRGEVRSKLRLLDKRGHEVRDLYVSPAGAPPVIAPRVPHYASWSPDSRMVSIVAAGADSLGLYLSDASGLFTADLVARGAPIFHSWSDDSRHVAIHAGAEVLLYRVAERETVHLASDAVGFRTPVFVAGGLVYGVASEAGVSLTWRALEGVERRVLGTFPAGVVFQRAGGGGATILSVAVADGEDASTMRGCWLYDLASPGPGQRVVRGPFHASAWSPAGDRVALIVPTQIGDGRVAVHVHDADGRFSAATEGFIPSQDLRIWVNFFDQYARSHPIWSPDGSSLVLCGRLAGDAVAGAFADHELASALYWPAQRGAGLGLVGRADSAFFAPRNGNTR